MVDPADDPALLFSLFWEGGKLNARTAEQFAGRLEDDGRTATLQPALYYPGADVPLPMPGDALSRVMERRASRRSFADRPLTTRELGSLLSACAHAPRRRIPSAGGKYPVEVFALLFRVEGPLAGKVVAYQGDTHALSVVGPCPSFAELAAALMLPGEGEPAAVVVLVGIPERVTRRYGERGGRFLLLEAGGFAQNLALRAAHDGLAGVLLGGLHDDTLARTLGLERASAAILAGYAVGHPRD
jgi:SagB-type dehydrogenase family enzyme